MTTLKESQAASDMTNIDNNAPKNATETRYALIGTITGWIKALGEKIA